MGGDNPNRGPFEKGGAPTFKRHQDETNCFFFFCLKTLLLGHSECLPTTAGAVSQNGGEMAEK